MAFPVRTRSLIFIGVGIALLALGAITFFPAQTEFNAYRPTGPPGSDYDSWHSSNTTRRALGATAAVAGMVAFVAGIATRLPQGAGLLPNDAHAAPWTEWTKQRLIGSIALYVVSIAVGYLVASIGLVIGGRLDRIATSTAGELGGALIFVCGVLILLTAPTFVAYRRRTPVTLTIAGVTALAGIGYAAVVVSRWPPTIESFTF